MIAYGAAGKRYSRDGLTQSLKSIAREKFDGNSAALARRCNFSKSLISVWVNDPATRISLPSLLAISGELGYSVVSLLAGEPEPSETNPATRTRRSPRNSIDRKEVEARLRYEVSRTDPSIPLRKLASLFGAKCYRTLKSAFPALCDQLIEKTREDRRQARLQAVQQKEELCRSVLLRIRERGLRPTLRNAELIVGKRWSNESPLGRKFLELRSKGEFELESGLPSSQTT